MKEVKGKNGSEGHSVSQGWLYFATITRSYTNMFTQHMGLLCKDYKENPNRNNFHLVNIY
jgi:hypothetical protein